jgi:hypothetical protein
MAMSERIPDFFIVGHHKSGTTALYEMLRHHPQIYMPELKEPKFFATDLPVRLEPSAARLLPGTMEEYLALFKDARPDQRVGEASPLYLRSRAAAGEIAKVRPDARIVAILREPASFMRSLHLQAVQSRVEGERDLRSALANEAVERGGREFHRYTDNVHYVDQVRRYHEAFSPEQVLVLIYDDFRSDNEGTVRRVLRFLDVDDTVPVHTVEANPTVRVRSLRANKAIYGLSTGTGPVSRQMQKTIKAVAPRSVRRAALHVAQRRMVYGEPDPVDEELMLELRKRFKGEVAAIGDYLGRDLIALWGYDSVE